MWDILTTIHTVQRFYSRDTFSSGVYIIMFDFFFLFVLKRQNGRINTSSIYTVTIYNIIVQYNIIYATHTRSNNATRHPLCRASRPETFCVKGVRKSTMMAARFCWQISHPAVERRVFFRGFKKLITGHLRLTNPVRIDNNNALHLCDGLFLFFFSFVFFLLTPRDGKFFEKKTCVAVIPHHGRRRQTRLPYYSSTADTTATRYRSCRACKYAFVTKTDGCQKITKYFVFEFFDGYDTI